MPQHNHIFQYLSHTRYLPCRQGILRTPQSHSSYPSPRIHNCVPRGKITAASTSRLARGNALRVPSVPGHCGGRSPACAASRAGYRNCAWNALSLNTRYHSHPKSVPPHRCRCRTGMPSPARYSQTAPPSSPGLSALPAHTGREEAPAKTDATSIPLER